MTKTVTAIQARRNLGEILNRAYYNGEETIVARKGKTIARIVPPYVKKTNVNSILSFAGILSTKDAGIIKKSVKTGREKSSREISSL